MSLRILTIHPGPSFSVADVHTGWVEALGELGCEMVALNLDDRLNLYMLAHLQNEKTGEWIRALDEESAVRLAAKGIEAACYEYQPDIVFVFSGFFVPLDILDLCRARGAKVVLYQMEEPYERDRELVRAGHADLNLINDPTHLDAFQAVAPTVYMPHAYRPAIHRPGPAAAEHRSDFCFVGSGFPSRIEFFEQVDWAGADVALAGHWQALAPESPLRKHLAHDIADCCDNDQAVLLYQGAKLSANLYRREADRPELAAGWATGPREIELAATGCCFLRDPRPEGDALFPMLPTFTGPDDFGEQLAWWLAHPDQRVAAGAQARAAVADRTFTSNARRLLELLGH